MVISTRKMIISKIIKLIRRLSQNLKLLNIKKHNQQNEKVAYGIMEMQVMIKRLISRRYKELLGQHKKPD